MKAELFDILETFVSRVIDETITKGPSVDSVRSEYYDEAMRKIIEVFDCNSEKVGGTD